MSDRTETAIAALVMLAAALILLAPLLGRGGATTGANVAMALASCAGLGAFVLAAISTCRAARRHPSNGEGESRDQD